VTRDIHII